MGRRTKPVIQQKTIYIGLRVDPALRQQLEDLARETDLTLTQIVRRAVKEYLEKAA
jgi:predicted transcriptional regulator